MPDIRIILADDHRIVRDGVKALLALSPDVKVVGEETDALVGLIVLRTCAA